MRKKTHRVKNSLEMKKKRRISVSLLISYLLILFVPSVVIIGSYVAVSHAWLNTQKGRIQNMLSEAVTTFDREVRQAENAGYYVSREKRLSDYLVKEIPSSKTEEFFSMYLISNNYPNYSLTNDIIQNVYVLIADSHYIMKIPQVIPDTELGITTLGGFPFYSYASFMEYFEKQNKKDTLFLCEGQKGQQILFLPSQISYPYTRPGKSAVIVQLSWKRINQILMHVLAGEEGVVALLDKNGNILSYCQNLNNGGVQNLKEGESWGEILENSEFDSKNLIKYEKVSNYNGWKLAAAVPESVLTERIGAISIYCEVFCTLSILAGLLICLYYWKRRERVVQEYFRIHKRLGTGNTGHPWKDAKFWPTFEGFLSSVDSLSDTLEMQSALIKEDFLRKLLYGGYDSGEKMRKHSGYAELGEDKRVYYIVDVELEGIPLTGENLDTAALEEMMEGLFGMHLAWDFWTYRVGMFSFVVLIRSGEELEGQVLKASMENIRLAVVEKLGIHCYMGISHGTSDEMEISQQRELASRISEFAKYKEIQVPLLPSDIPVENVRDSQYFSMEQEVKLLQILNIGTTEQLDQFLDELHREYFDPQISQYVYNHALEVLRSTIFRSISPEDQSGEAMMLRKRTQNARREDEIFHILKEVKLYRLQNYGNTEKAVSSLDKERIAEFLDQNYGDCNLNISLLAQRLGESERKLYNDFKICFGMSFSSYLEQLRMQHACRLLREGKAVKETADLVGYSSDYSFRRAFKRIVGITPSDFRAIPKD